VSDKKVIAVFVMEYFYLTIVLKCILAIIFNLLKFIATILFAGIPYERKTSALFLTKKENEANHVNLFLNPLGACGAGPTAPGCRRMLAEQHDQSYLELVQCDFQLK
jgi:hypothetical protein